MEVSRIAALGWAVLCCPFAVMVATLALLWRHVDWSRSGRRK